MEFLKKIVKCEILTNVDMISLIIPIQLTSSCPEQTPLHLTGIAREAGGSPGGSPLQESKGLLVEG